MAEDLRLVIRSFLTTKERRGDSASAGREESVLVVFCCLVSHLKDDDDGRGAREFEVAQPGTN